MGGVGKLLLAAGGVLLILGLILTLAGRVPFLAHLGRLPGDIRIVRPGFQLYVPVTTSILVSVVLTLVLRLFLKR